MDRGLADRTRRQQGTGRPANGYLLEQFLHDRLNKCTDIYGGPGENCARLLLEVAEAVAGIWRPDRVGVRLSPFATYNSVGDSDPVKRYSHVFSSLHKLNIAYGSLIQACGGGGMQIGSPNAGHRLRTFGPGTLILAGGFTADTAEEAIRSGRADAIAFEPPFLANPDLPLRLKLGAQLNLHDCSAFYGGGAAGYIDYSESETAEQAG